MWKRTRVRKKDGSILTIREYRLPRDLLKFLRDSEHWKQLQEIIVFRLKLRWLMIKIVFKTFYAWMVGADIGELREIYQTVIEWQKIVRERNSFEFRLKMIRRKR
jgi:hypothetical protein